MIAPTAGERLPALYGSVHICIQKRGWTVVRQSSPAMRSVAPDHASGSDGQVEGRVTPCGMVGAVGFLGLSSSRMSGLG